MVDQARLQEAKDYVEAEINKNLAIASKAWQKVLYIGQENNPKYKLRDSGLAPEVIEHATNNSFNIRSPQKFMAFLKDYGYTIPKITNKTDEGEWESKESTAELALREMIRENQFGGPNGDEALIAVLNVRELVTLRSRSLNARLFDRPEGSVYLSSYNAGSGTLTGRRSSKKHIYGYGGNGQNFPKHNITAEKYRRSLVARPGYIFLSVDQISAEDWPVSALAGNVTALQELKTGTDRHTKLASFMFGIPIESRDKKQWKDSIERYLGKKSRHAGNYDMKAPRMHDTLMQEGKYFPVEACQQMLERFHASDPLIKNGFHKYIQDCINRNKTLITPFGRERQFLEFRPNSKNGNLWNEAYSYIPQSFVGDNTGFALEELQITPEKDVYILQEGHDSIVQEVVFDSKYRASDVSRLNIALERTIESFDRECEFYNGIKINIPVEAELSWDFGHSVKIETLDRKGIEDALNKLGNRAA